MTGIEDVRQGKLKVIYHGLMHNPAFAGMRKPGIHFVPGRGSMVAPLVFVGEAPGEQENKRRKPFVGPSGHLFHQLLEHVGLRRDDVFVTNAVKYRPVVGTAAYRNRKPWPSELKAALKPLRDELSVFRGARVVLMGSTAIQCLTGQMRASVSVLHGSGSFDDDFHYFFLYHPAYGLYDTDNKPTLFKDMERMREWMG